LSKFFARLVRPAEAGRYYEMDLSLISADGRRGHRLTGDPYDGEYRLYGYGNSRINGVTGSIRLQIGGGL
jgi:hypothetical protein